jgi:pimeloyl-ACP methyl ester carboxylesterase
MLNVRAGVLEVALEVHGDPDGWPVVLLHGFPYDTGCYDGVAPILAAAGAHVVVPYLRGYGPLVSWTRPPHEPIGLRPGAGIGERVGLQRAEHSRRGVSRTAGDRAQALVPVPPARRPRAVRIGRTPPRVHPTAVARMVTGLAIHRRRVRCHCSLFRQPGLRRRRGALLSAPFTGWFPGTRPTKRSKTKSLPSQQSRSRPW